MSGPFRSRLREADALLCLGYPKRILPGRTVQMRCGSAVAFRLPPGVFVGSGRGLFHFIGGGGGQYTLLLAEIIYYTATPFNLLPLVPLGATKDCTQGCGVPVSLHAPARFSSPPSSPEPTDTRGRPRRRDTRNGVPRCLPRVSRGLPSEKSCAGRWTVAPTRPEELQRFFSFRDGQLFFIFFFVCYTYIYILSFLCFCSLKEEYVKVIILRKRDTRCRGEGSSLVFLFW